MLHHRRRAATLLALLAVLVLAPGAAAGPAKHAAGAKAKERAYGKHCGAEAKGAGRSGQRAKCLGAMARLATGRSSTPRKACRALSRKKAQGERKSPFARCVSAGAKLLRSRGAPRADDATGDDDDDGDPDSEPGDDDDELGAGADLDSDLGLGAGDASSAPDAAAPAHPDDDR